MLLKKSTLKVVLLSLALGISVTSCDLAGLGGLIAKQPGVNDKTSGDTKSTDLAGGFTKQDPTKQEYQDIAKTAEKLMNEKYPDRGFMITKLDEVYTQVVAGMNYKLICEFKDNKGTDKAEIVVYKDLQGKFSIIIEGVINASVTSGEQVGGFTKQDPTKQEYQDIAKTAEKLMNEKYPDRGFMITKLDEVYTQVVAGMNYKLICEFKDNKGTDKAEIVVYKDLQGKFSITSEGVIN